MASGTPTPTADSKPKHTPADARKVGLAAFFRRNIDAVTTEGLDLYRRHGEDVGAAIIAGDLTGDDLAAICDHEIAGRYAALTGERDALGSEGR